MTDIGNLGSCINVVTSRTKTCIALSNAFVIACFSVIYIIRSVLISFTVTVCRPINTSNFAHRISIFLRCSDKLY